MVSPLVLVSDNGGGFNPTGPNGLNIGAGDPVSITLQTPTPGTNWYLQIGLVTIMGGVPVVIAGTGTDETQGSPPALTGVNGSGLVTGGPSATVTFTFPGAGTALLFTSTITGGFGPPISTTFGLFALTAGSQRVGAAGMTREGSGAYGWAAIVNPAIRAVGTSGVTLSNNGTPIAGNPHTTLNLTGSISAADAGGGVATVNGSGGGGSSGDNGAAQRALLTRRATYALGGADNAARTEAVTAVNDGAEALFAGKAIGVFEFGPSGKAPAKLYFAGKGSSEGELWSYDLGGQRLEKLGTLQGPHNPDDLCLASTPGVGSYVFIATVGKGGVDFWADGAAQGDSFLNGSNSAGGEDWSDGQIVALPNVAGGSFPCIFFWTAPNHGKVYTDGPYGGSATAHVVGVGEYPQALCFDNDGNLWVSFIASNVIRKYSVTIGLFGVVTLTKIGSDISNAGTTDVQHMLFDGEFIWTTNPGVAVYKLSASDGSIVGTAPFFSGGPGAQSRLAFDGMSIWYGAGNGGLGRIDPNTMRVVNNVFGTHDNGARGIFVTSDGTVYYGTVDGIGPNTLQIESISPYLIDPPTTKSRVCTCITNSTTYASFAAFALNPAYRFFPGAEPANVTEYTITAIATAGNGDDVAAWFKKRIRVECQSGPTVTAQFGDPVDVDDSPKKNGNATTRGLGLSIAVSGNLVVGTVTQSSGTNTSWTFVIEEKRGDHSSYII